MADLFLCERKGCGHPMNVHNPCNATIGKGKTARLCGCPAFEPEAQRQRVASLTDTQAIGPAEQARRDADLAKLRVQS